MIANVQRVAVAVFAMIAVVATQVVPPYVKQCRANDPKLVQCVTGAVHHLRPYLAAGIPEIQMPTVEPFRLDELSLALTSGPRGYKITLRDMDIRGVSNYTVTKLKLGKQGAPFESMIRIPQLTMFSDYKSSGVLLILPASGSGIFHNTMKDVTAKVRGTVKFYDHKGSQYMNVDTLELDIDTKSLAMRIEKAFQNNPILREATNLFLRENGLEVFTAMKPQLNAKLAEKFKDIANTMLKNTPISMFYLE